MHNFHYNLVLVSDIVHLKTEVNKSNVAASITLVSNGVPLCSSKFPSTNASNDCFSLNAHITSALYLVKIQLPTLAKGQQHFVILSFWQSAIHLL